MSSLSNYDKHSQATKAVWAGEKPYRVHGASQVPLVHSVAYTYDDLDHWYEVAIGNAYGHIYGRNTNPTVESFEEKMRILEGAEAATSFSTGMAAISNSLHTFLRPGDRIVTIKDTYGGTNKIFSEFLPKLNIDITFCDTGEHEQVEKEIAKGCQLVYLETPTNPTVKVTDIERMVKAAKAQNALIFVDNTFATPLNQNPLKYGVDLVIHSATKFLGGHADALGGVICGNKDLVEKVFHYREINGATMDPNAAYFMIRGLKTLDLRITRQCESAQKIAEYLQQHPLVEDVFYPGLKDHSHHDIAKKQMKRFGGMLSFSMKNGMAAVKEFLPKLELANRAANLGAVETTVGPARTTSHVENTPEERKELGIPESLVRYSVGIEDVDDLINDIEQAFSYVTK
ncbi:cystathionine gamma-synthase family protein [Salsuginibacillus kocurii]|uniref:cystathionine gamma-synthase family protein n=1 Tax=Salsuginibacillus kocurii TaxID=427078 RepID=UPI00036C44AC|nr:cystathionine gamma-synthase family protein [Salsuginibacillus kocurii]